MSGTQNTTTSVSTVDRAGFGSFSVGPAASADWNVIARNTAVGSFMRLDVHGSGEACHFWGMIIPSALKTAPI